MSGNYQLANYFSRWECGACGAITAITHKADSSPSISMEPIGVSLSSPGHEEMNLKGMKGKHWGFEGDFDSGTFWKKGYSHPSGPHRKGDEQWNILVQDLLSGTRPCSFNPTHTPFLTPSAILLPEAGLCGVVANT